MQIYVSNVVQDMSSSYCVSDIAGLEVWFHSHKDSLQEYEYILANLFKLIGGEWNFSHKNPFGSLHDGGWCKPLSLQWHGQPALFSFLPENKQNVEVSSNGWVCPHYLETMHIWEQRTLFF